MAQSEKACSPWAHARHMIPAARYQTATRKVARGNSRKDAKMPRLNKMDHKPGNIHSDSGTCCQKTADTRPPAARHGKNWPMARAVSVRDRGEEVCQQVTAITTPVM